MVSNSQEHMQRIRNHDKKVNIPVDINIYLIFCLISAFHSHPGIERASLVSPVLAGGFFTSSTTCET